jgi:hypothetical protein
MVRLPTGRYFPERRRYKRHSAFQSLRQTCRAAWR